VSMADVYGSDRVREVTTSEIAYMCLVGRAALGGVSQKALTGRVPPLGGGPGMYLDDIAEVRP
jgi:hypothetical protein